MKSVYMLAPLFILTAAAPPEELQTKSDVRCLVAISSLQRSDDAAIKAAAALGMLYFMGRLDGRNPNLDYEAAMAAEAGPMKGQNISGLLQTCGKTMQDRGKMMMEVGERLQRRGI